MVEVIATIEVFAKFTVAGLHQWPRAPADVHFLRSKHRHEFHITVGLLVDHPDRDIEFIMLERRAREVLAELYPWVGVGYDFGTDSCEAIGIKLLKCLPIDYCTVSEDGLHGATVRQRCKPQPMAWRIGEGEE